MIERIGLQVGPNRGAEALSFDTTPVTVFVGPNNSGKSRILEEINQSCKNGGISNSYKLINSLDFFSTRMEEIDQEIESIRFPEKGEIVVDGEITVGDGRGKTQISIQELRSLLLHPNRNKYPFCTTYLAYKTLKLDGLGRISLVNNQVLNDLQEKPSNVLSTLFKDDDKRTEVRRIVFDAFGKHFVLDPTEVGKVRIRLSETEPNSHQQERGLHDDAVKFHRQAQEIGDFSDGVKAFVGIIISVVAGKPKVTILDEPEAFLHPSLSCMLGKEIAASAKVGLNRLFVSTHSSNFLMGCIQSGAPMNIVRLTYLNNVGTARLLDNEKIGMLMKDPLLRSVGVLNALFYDCVVVVEGDSDRAFYQEINERLIQFDPKKCVSNCLFLNAVGKDTIWRIVRPLREMGIPTVGIYDVDILKNEGSNWTNALKSSFIPKLNTQPMGQTRSLIKKKFDDLKVDMKTEGGVDALPDQDKEAANNLFNQLEEYGIFVVRKGELENWLPSLKIHVHKSVWLSAIFEAMGSNPDDSDYLKPSKGDVWSFIGRIGSWMKDPNRKGIPFE